MKIIKSKRGGKRDGAGRPPDGESPRILITAKILPETKSKIDQQRGDLSVGKFIDSIILNK